MLARVGLGSVSSGARATNERHYLPISSGLAGGTGKWIWGEDGRGTEGTIHAELSSRGTRRSAAGSQSPSCLLSAEGRVTFRQFPTFRFARLAVRALQAGSCLTWRSRLPVACHATLPCPSDRQIIPPPPQAMPRPISRYSMLFGSVLLALPNRLWNVR